jgi:Pyruvate/2-oxoacid:ferredoxin oxidoreductase delta subunit
MDLDYLIQYTLLYLVCFIFIFGLAVRFAFFIFTIIKGNIDKDIRWRYILSILWHYVSPLSITVTTKTIYTLLGCVFHACLIVIPIWYSGHIVLWGRYGFEWYWTALPDGWIDGLTLLLLGLAASFLIRRIISKDVRRTSTFSDYLVTIITAMPFLTGYFLSQGSLEDVLFFGDNMENIHVLSAEAMILMASFLFCRIRLTASHCTGCAACELHCPTGALVSEEKEERRIIIYTLYKCICCGSCTTTCPEEAASLRHEVSFAGYFRLMFKQTIRSVEIKACERCGNFFAPILQIEKLRKIVDGDHMYLCLSCKRRDTAQRLSIMTKC